MTWLTANWFWVLIAIAFVAMHLFGHGGHAGHSGHGGHREGDRKRSRDDGDIDARGRRVNTGAGGHQH